ncbi:MAG: hypothetical protein ACLUFN_01980 [Eubacterium sp.]
MYNKLPKSISTIISEKDYIRDSIGESGATILIFDKYVLKIEDANDSSNNEIVAMNWLKGKLPVPEIIKFVCENSKNYILCQSLTTIWHAIKSN